MPDLFPSPDPIQSPKAYQDHLLGLLGEDDPAVVQAQTPSTLRTLAAEAGANLFRRPEPVEWSVGECRRARVRRGDRDVGSVSVRPGAR